MTLFLLSLLVLASGNLTIATVDAGNQRESGESGSVSRVGSAGTTKDESDSEDTEQVGARRSDESKDASPAVASAESSVPETKDSDVKQTESPQQQDKTAVKQVRVERNLRFSQESGRAGLCDIYLPADEPPPEGYPVIVVVHGGAWMSGDKWTLEGYSRLLAEHNMAAMTINYRLAPSHKFPAQVDDVRSALLWAKENAERFQWDANCLGIFGYSAGGHLCALIGSLADEAIEVQAAASEWPADDQKWTQLPSIRAVCAGGPPCDFRSFPEDNIALSYFLGGSRRERPDTYVSASPAAHVSAEDPVTQIIHGDSDLLVPLLGSEKFHRAQVAAGVDSRLEVMPNQGHMVTFLNPDTSNKMVDFFYEVLDVEARKE